MAAEPDLNRLARTMGEPTRMGMLALLMEGRALTAKELAHGMGVTPATATAHLRRLLADSLISVSPQGRHKYFCLSSPEVANCVEALMAVAPRQIDLLPRPDTPLRRARLCYDHLAGRLGLLLVESLTTLRWIVPADRNFTVNRKDERAFAELGLDLPALRGSRRHFACGCLDWSERKDHLGGALGAALADLMFSSGWLKRKSGTRCVAVTKKGSTALAADFGIEWPAD